jgi:5'-methylthioadenosine phosphorylase
MMKVGIIGGSGLDDPKLVENYEEKEIETRYGKPSSSITCGKIAGVDVCILARHGRKHEIPPSKVNNRANIAALKMLGVSHILATSAVGSLREEIKRGDFVILDQLIDFTRHREVTFHESFENGAEHVSLADPFSDFLRKKIILAASELGIPFHSFGTVITIEGPRFSTRAESLMFRQWGADVINMSIAPEAVLAREAGIEYSAIAMSTDYDCWKEDEKPVSWDEILRIFKENSEKMKRLLLRVIEKISRNDEDFIKKKITSIPDWPKPGIIFRDITTLLKDAEGFQKVLNLLEERYKNKDIDVIAGIESRGFILASALASRLGKGLTIIRKPGKLPRETVREEYELEYGTDAVEIHKEDISSGQKVLLVDDLIATGGTVSAACSLIERLGGKVVECVFAIELEELGGREKLEENGYSVFSIVKFNESER